MSHTHENRDDKVSLVEMGPRDGLQNEAATLSLAQRLAFGLPGKIRCTRRLMHSP